MTQVLDIAPLRSLVAVADCGGFHRAAAVLHVTQSAVSQHVRRIEGVVGGPIVERSGRGVAFTELGYRVLMHGRRILAAHDDALAELCAVGERALLVGATEHGADVMLPGLTETLGERLADWRIRFRLDRNVVLGDAIEQGTVDVAVLLDGSGWDRSAAIGGDLKVDAPANVAGIIETAKRVREVAREVRPNRESKITASVSQHVPKPHTPYQWNGMRDREYFRWAHQYLRNRVTVRSVRVKCHSIERSLLEGILTRGDRRIAHAMLEVWKRGARLDAWDEYFQPELWWKTFEDLCIEVMAKRRNHVDHSTY